MPADQRSEDGTTNFANANSQRVCLVAAEIRNRRMQAMIKATIAATTVDSLRCMSRDVKVVNYCCGLIYYTLRRNARSYFSEVIFLLESLSCVMETLVFSAPTVFSNRRMSAEKKKS